MIWMSHLMMKKLPFTVIIMVFSVSLRSTSKFTSSNLARSIWDFFSCFYHKETSWKHVSYIAIMCVCVCVCTHVPKAGNIIPGWKMSVHNIKHAHTKNHAPSHTQPFARLFKTDMTYCTLSIVTSISSFLQQSIRPQ